MILFSQLFILILFSFFILVLLMIDEKNSEDKENIFELIT